MKWPDPYLNGRDQLYRLGGEEFVLLLPGTDHSGARAALEKVRDEVQAQPLADGLRVTTSIGAAVLWLLKQPARAWTQEMNLWPF